MMLQAPENSKLIKSAVISLGGLGFALLIQWLFPGQNALVLSIVALVGAWIVNTLKESLGL